MADEKREQAKRDALAKFVETYHSNDEQYPILEKVALLDGFDAGHATAEGIPQSDGWVAIGDLDSLPQSNGRYVTQEIGGVLRIQDYDSHRRELWPAKCPRCGKSNLAAKFEICCM